MVAGTLIQVTVGMDTGRVGTVIGSVMGRHSGMSTLVVFFEDNRLDVCVLPECVRILSAPDPGQVVWLSDDELQHLYVCE